MQRARSRSGGDRRGSSRPAERDQGRRCTQEGIPEASGFAHIRWDDLKREIRRNRTEEKLFNKEITSRINITDADIRPTTTSTSLTST